MAVSWQMNVEKVIFFQWTTDKGIVDLNLILRWSKVTQRNFKSDHPICGVIRGAADGFGLESQPGMTREVGEKNFEIEWL
jgi:hypothetical protein